MLDCLSGSVVVRCGISSTFHPVERLITLMLVPTSGIECGYVYMWMFGPRSETLLKVLLNIKCRSDCGHSTLTLSCCCGSQVLDDLVAS